MTRTNKTRKHNKNKKNKKNKTVHKFKEDSCAPRQQHYYTCYSGESLHKLKDLWNIRHSDKKILTNDPREIWKKLKYFMKNSCNRESCWLRQNFIKHKLDKSLLNYTFAPNYPDEWRKDPDEWLNSLDILNVMSQYENKFPEFEFLGPSPIDYHVKKYYGECVWDELCKFDISKYLEKNKTKIGIIFNLDEHDEEGSHWVAVFIDAIKKEVYYFDSYGDKPPKNIKKFINTVQKQTSLLGTKFKYFYNNKRHQYKNSECGMYCLYFIISLLQYGGNFQHFLETRVTDREMLDLRKKFFNY